jgi:hypothetical protein
MVKLPLFILVMMCAGMPAFADVIDQDQPSGPVYMAGFSQSDLAQSFVQSSGAISGAGILLQAGVGESDDVRISVWTGLPNAGGTMLAQANAQGTQGEWVDVFWSPVSVTPGVTYYLVFDGNSTLGIAGDTNNPYPNGCVYANPGFQIFPAFDYAFRTYYAGIAAGACCWPDGRCTYGSAVSCDYGDYQGNNTYCDPNPCVPYTAGACCVSWGCIVLRHEQCDDSGGQYIGDDTTCYPDPCHATPTKITTWGHIKGSYR